MHELSLVVVSSGYPQVVVHGLSSVVAPFVAEYGHIGSIVVVHGPCCSAACGIPTDQGSNLSPLYWQADS